jgi:catechol 2,3-dioxygenase-like lactoylglutathione lyase family enzyme
MNHLHVNVPDLVEAIRFYERYFEFRRVYPESERVFLKDASGFLLAIDPIGADSEPHFPEWFHFGICRNDPDWARGLFIRMKSDGVKFASELEDYKNAVVFFCWAPGPYKVEVRGNKSS